MVDARRAIVALCVSLVLASAASAVHVGSCFAVPPATAFRRTRTSYFGRPRSVAIESALLMTPVQNDDREANRRKYAAQYKTRIPRHPEEVAGVTTGLGLWGETRRRAWRRRRQLLREKWDALRMRRSGRRRKKLAARMKKLLSGNKQTSPDDALEAKDLDSLEEDEDDDDTAATSLDAMRARAGVLRTRIRIRQESLSDLERLTTDVKLELRRSGWKNAFDANAGYTNRTVFMYGQAKEESGGSDTGEVMNEAELMALNEKWKTQQTSVAPPKHAEVEQTNDGVEPDNIMEELQLDLMEQRSHKLENSILLDRIRLQRLEKRILCFEAGELGIVERALGNTLDSLNELELLSSNPLVGVQRRARKFVNTFGESTLVLLRKLDRVSSRSGANNRDYASVTDFVALETAAGVRIVGNLLSNPSQLSQLVDPDTPTLVPHVPAILARLDRLESHVAPILSHVLNNKRHLRSIEPYLGEILERFDDIEPHLPWILEHIDTLAPYTGLLLKHVDELLLYAEVDDYEAGENSKDKYAFAEQLLPYLEVYVSQLDLVGPHLPLLRPHLPLLLKHNRIKILSPHVGRLFSKGYKDLSASANMDILLFYFGWALRIPFVPRIFFSFPGSPGTVSFLANRLPKRLVRGRCCDVSCYVDGDYGSGWNELSK
ncbi:hypothetical protein ACHAXT_009773 [Thalassiosira profunda]